MTDSIIQKIEHIRSLPEHIRLRYTLVAVAICMIFVIGVWILTLKQGFLHIAPEVSDGKNQAEESLSQVKESFPDKESLKTLKESSGSLQVDTNKEGAEDFLQQELTRQNPNSPANQE